MTAAAIKLTAMELISGQAEVIWCDDSYPGQGLIICRPQNLEAALLGTGSLRLSGPWMVEPDQNLRYKKARTLAQRAKVLAQQKGSRFLSIKTWHDPAIIRGFCDEGFQLAEILTSLAGTPDLEEMADGRTIRTQGLSLRKPHPWELAEWLLSLGDLFYDGHLLHGPYFGPDMQRRLWQELASLDLKNNQPMYFLWQDRPEKLIGLGWGRVSETEGNLMAIHVSEQRRGQGLGTYLLESVWRQMSSLGARELVVETASWNIPAQALYRSIGLLTKVPLVALHLFW
jgi:ribosomal protein S18 acetylase RimI-like enzyme